MKNKKIKIAIQKKGRLSNPSKEFLMSLGLKFPMNTKKLTLQCKNMPISLVKVRDDDIPKYVSEGAVDFGIVGLDVVKEMEKKVKIIKKLGFSKCQMVIAVPRISDIRKIKDLEGKKIATSYPNILRTFLRKNQIRAKIVVVKGSVELAPYLKTADAVCDITQTGTTLKAFNLIPFKTILRSQAVLIESPNINPNKKIFLNLCQKI